MDIKNFECKKHIRKNVVELEISYRLFASYDSSSPAYSIGVTLVESGEVADESFVCDIARNIEEAERIFELICENDVTPYSLDECLDAVFDIL